DHRRATGKIGGDDPTVAAEQELDGDDRHRHHEHDLEHRARREIGDHRAYRDAGHCRNGPPPYHIVEHHTFGAMCEVGADRGRDDDGHRGADAEVHADLLRHAENSENLVQHGYDNGAAPDAEQAGEDAGGDSSHHDGSNEQYDFAERHPHHDVTPRRVYFVALRLKISDDPCSSGWAWQN